VDFISFVPGILIVILIYVYNGLSMSGSAAAESMTEFLAVDTIVTHFKDTGFTPESYDLY